MTRIFVLGLDGASPELVNLWIDKLPAFRKMMGEGASGILTSTILPVTPPAWTSFATGKNPGGHGIFDWLRRDENGYNLVPVSSRDVNGKPFWTLMSESGKKVGLMNVPVTYPPEKLNGFIITGMPVPRSSVYWYPQGLMDELKKETGGYAGQGARVYSKSGAEDFLKELHENADKKIKAALYLMEAHQWDFFIVVLDILDEAHHALYQALDPMGCTPTSMLAHRETTTGSTPTDELLRCYMTADSAIAKIRDKLDSDTVFFVISDHGVAPLRKFIYLNNWLARMGYMKFRSGAGTKLKLALHDMGFTPERAYTWMLRSGIGRIRRSVSPLREYLFLSKLFLSFADVDWGGTRAYSVGYGGQIYINKKGREPEGVVGETEYDALRNEIIKKLYELRDPETSETVVDKVFKKEEIYSGGRLDEAPDIIFLTKKLSYVSFGRFEFASRLVFGRPFGISASHSMDGLIMVCGEKIKNVKINAGIADLAPTFLHMFDLRIPRDMDGRIITELFETCTAPKLGSAPKAKSREQEHYAFSAREEKEIEERLRALGYI
jgi:predicted AlkP superfamily phosphohydrolase/phosphomutase